MHIVLVDVGLCAGLHPQLAPHRCAVWGHVRADPLPACLPACLCSVSCFSVSRGFSIKLLKFDDQGKLKLSRVNRQMTQQEQQQLVNPGVK